MMYCSVVLSTACTSSYVLSLSCIVLCVVIGVGLVGILYVCRRMKLS